MFMLDTYSPASRKARFDTFADVAACAVTEARQRGEAKVRCRETCALLYIFVRREDGTVSVYATERAT